MGLAASRQEAFWEACGFGNEERARKFLEQGDIDVNWVSYVNDCSPIHTASQGKPAIVQLLLEYKCDVNVKDNRGNLAIHHAAMVGHADIVQTLIEAGSQIDTQEKNGWTALHNACYWCHPKVVEMLIKKGCDVNIQNKDERTALHEVARSHSTDDDKLGEIARMLIDAGCNINAKSSDRGEADLTGLMYAAYHNHPEVAQALIDAGCDMDAVGSTFWTALHWAADRGNDEVVYILVDAGANPLKKNMRGEIAADKAQSDEMRDVLLNAANMYRELHFMKEPLIALTPDPIAKPIEPYVPKCDAHFKSESFLPKDWKPSTNLQKLKDLRERLREQHLKSLKNTSPIKIITHEIEQGPSKGKEMDLKHREPSEGPDSHESSEDSDAIATDTDASSETDSLSQLVSEATIVDYINIEKGKVRQETSNVISESQGLECNDQVEKSHCKPIREDLDTVGDVVNKDCEVEISEGTTQKCENGKTNKEGKTESDSMNLHSESEVAADHSEGQENIDITEKGHKVNATETDRSDPKENSENENTGEMKVTNEAARDSVADDTDNDPSECRKIV